MDMTTDAPKATPDYDGVLENLPLEEGARLLIDDFAWTLGRADMRYVLDSAGRQPLSFTVLEQERGRCRIGFATGDASGELLLSIDASGWVRAEATLGGRPVFLGFVEKVWEEYDIWPAGADISVPRSEEAPGRIGKRRNWLSLDSRVWPELAPIGNEGGFVQVEDEQL
jgi:hypothetical protein